jgi:7-cyano-7-deazaguanine synthase
MTMPRQIQKHDKPVAVVLLSGGLDSATVLAIAQQNYHCHAISFNYSQRHVAELMAAENIARSSGVEHRVIRLDDAVMTGSALTDARIDVPETTSAGIPVTYVPARNTIFLAHALAVAEVLGSNDIFIGVNAVDYSGYPDCRPEYIEAFETMANLATKVGVEGGCLKIHAPLIRLSKAEIIRAGVKLGVDYARTVSCYQADAEGRACGVCDSCRLRRSGFTAAGIEDPTRYRQHPC